MSSPLPKVSVLMPVYNGERYLAEAIDSILAQTFADFELLVVNDGSTDASRDIVEGYSDPRIRLLDNPRNLGLTATLNIGLDQCRGTYIARLDCDDVALPARLARQVAFMDQHPDVGVCGSWYQRFGSRVEVFESPVEDWEIRLALTFENIFGHSTVMLRRGVLEQHGLRYDPSYLHAEDYEFWVRCARHTRLHNLPEALVRYRDHDSNVSSRHAAAQKLTADRIREEQLADLDFAADERERRLYHAVTHHCFDGDLQDLQAVAHWLERFAAHLAQRFQVPIEAVGRRLSLHWYVSCGLAAGFGLPVWRLFMGSTAGRIASRSYQMKLLARCLLKLPIPWDVINPTISRTPA